MVRNVLALLLVGGAVALFVLLAYKSQPVDFDQHSSHGSAISLINESIADYEILTREFNNARRNVRPVDVKLQTALDRIVVANEKIDEIWADRAAAGAAEAELGQHLEQYSNSVEQLAKVGENFIVHHDALARALQQLRESSPGVVQQLRVSGRRSMSNDTFSLVTQTLDYARLETGVDAEDLLKRVERLAAQSNAPAKLGALLYSVKTVLEERDLTERGWAELNQSQFLESAKLLSSTLEGVLRAQLGTVERYRVLLTVYSSLLLLGLGFLGFRLYQSYRDLNETNAELEQFNENLELRVQERTEELAEAYESVKESQVQLVQAAKMSSLGQLVAGISHEINTPLLYLRSNATLIKERLDALAEFVEDVQQTLSLVRGSNTDTKRFLSGLKSIHKRLQDGIPEDVEDSLGLIQDSVEGLAQLSDMAQSLKDFSRLDRAPVAKFDVNDGLDKTLLIAKNLLKSKVTIHKQYSEVPEITCSPSQINQVFLNLISNAAQAIGEKGDIVLKTRSEGDQVWIRISDTGCGMSKEQLSRIRDPFFTTKEVGEGTGLGLSIVDKIVGAHGGSLEIESKEGKGSAFTIKLPIDPPDFVEQSQAEVEQEPVAEAV